MSGPHKYRKSSGTRGMTPEQVELYDDRNRKLYLLFKAGTMSTRQMALTFHLSRDSINKYRKLYREGAWEHYAPVTPPQVRLAPVVRWVTSGFIPAPTKERLMAGR